MNKKIVILNGGPRANGNTAALIDAFTAGAQSAGNTVVRFDLQKMDIRGCIGCLKGGRNPDSPCVQKDDMSLIYPHYQEADVVVLASPMYYFGVTGQLKCAFDRLFAVAECNPQQVNPVKGCVLLMPAGDTHASQFAPVQAFYDALLTQIGWVGLGVLYAGGNLDAGDALQNPEQLAQAHALGAGIA